MLLPLCLLQPLFIDPPFLDKIMFHPRQEEEEEGLTWSSERCGEVEEEEEKMEGVDPRNSTCHLKVLSFDVLEKKDFCKV